MCNAKNNSVKGKPDSQQPHHEDFLTIHPDSEMDKTKAILMHDGALLLLRDNTGLRLPYCHEILQDIAKECDFTIATDCIVKEIPTDAIPKVGFEMIELRTSYSVLSQEDYRLAAKGRELLVWKNDNKFCSRCGSKMLKATEISRKCCQCGYEIWPSPSPAILVLVTKGEEALLVHAKSFSRPFYGLVAGFVETGESLEECVVREVKEETGLDIGEVKYFGSQPWPFPFNLMVGFTARYKDGNIGKGDGELSDARFFSREACPPIPSMPSLARIMINAWLDGNLPA